MPVVRKKAPDHIRKLVISQKKFFASGATKEIPGRLEQLKKLGREIKRREKDITKALYKDIRKPEFETLITETHFILSELRYCIKNLKKWSKPVRVRSSLLNFPSRDLIVSEPLGQCLILAPWNYPFQLQLSPVIGALAAGNTIILKPSEHAPHTSAVVASIFREVFPPEWAAVVQGPAETSERLLQEKWDYVFFTGSQPVAKRVAQAIAPHLTPATYELGGKSPCIVHRSANLSLAAKRITWGKFINAGQTCIAPDYVLVDQSIREAFFGEMEKEIIRTFGKHPEASPDYARIVNLRNFDRLTDLLTGERCRTGGKWDREALYMAPTLLEEPAISAPVMQQEIFGPVLPVLGYDSDGTLETLLGQFPTPLAFYLFSEDRRFTRKILRKFPFGGGAVNDVLVHIANKRLPFGGVGSSGHGAYHGKYSFDTFSHRKSICHRGTWFDNPLRYAPYGMKMKLSRKLLKYF